MPARKIPVWFKKILTSPLEEILSMDRGFGLARKIMIYLLGVFFFFLLYHKSASWPKAFNLFAFVGAGYALYALLLYSRRVRVSSSTPHFLWYGGFLLDLFFLSALIYYGGSLVTPLLLLYPLTMVGVALNRPYLRDFLAGGLLGHLSYTLGLYFLFRDWSFYFLPEFWAIGLLVGISFAFSLLIVMLLNSDRQKLRNLAGELMQKNEILESLTVTDTLTGLYNHRYFWKRIQEEMERCKRHDRKLTLLMLDLDYFKIYNDTLGHLQGDSLLAELANIMRVNMRTSDVICRYGGDEFTLILTETGRTEGINLADRLRLRISEHPFPGREAMPKGKITVTIGVAVFPDDAHEARILVNQADNAAYAAKQRNKDQVRCYGSLLQDLHQGQAEEDNVYQTLETLLAVINAKDKYTRGHSERVAEYVRLLSAKIGFDQDQIRSLSYAAFLHDLGKIEISREILNKRGSLNEEEWEIIRKHTLFGVNIIEPLMSASTLIPAIKHHHERYDGQGYPEGKKGENIPLGARILALADSFDAMLSERPYRRALSPQEAILEIQNGAGKQFDPYLANLFVAAIQERFESPA